MLLILSYILAAIGLIISLVGLPGVWLIFIAVVISAVSVGLDIIPIWLIFIYLVVTVLSGFVDNVAVAVGAGRYGASKWGMAGAILGGIIGFLTGNIVGLIFGPFIGAVAFELIFANKTVDSAVKAGIGTFIGYLFSIFLKFAIAVIMVSTWLRILIK